MNSRLHIFSFLLLCWQAKKLESFGVKGVVGSLDDYDLVEDLVSKAHVIIDTVSGFQLGLRFLADWHSFIIG